MEDTIKPRLLLTGATGFLGNHLCKALLEENLYKIRATTTKLSNKKKIEDLKRACKERLSEVELVELDVMNKE